MSVAVPVTRDEMEARRMAAAYELRAGVKQCVVAGHFGVSRVTVSRWAALLESETGGIESLRKRKATGRPSLLTQQQQSEVARIRSAYPHLTYQEIADWIHRNYGVEYNESHVGRLLKRLGCAGKRQASAP